MHLLQRNSGGGLTLADVPNDGKLPPYAVLSHTWEHGEVTFQDIQSESYRQKPGLRKIQFCAEQAAKDGFEYFWVDTCCINRSSPTELSDAVVSMFEWYHTAAKCYVFLADVSAPTKRAHDDDTHIWQSSFRSSRWFTRGWTLQELLAPAIVEFYSVEGLLLGNKTTLLPMLSEITTIPASALQLQGDSLEAFTIPERMRWASGRSTTITEDRAYSLMGIFGVHMMPRYGEGGAAMPRLIEEIGKHQIAQLYKSGYQLLGSKSPVPIFAVPDTEFHRSAQKEPLHGPRSGTLNPLIGTDMAHGRYIPGLSETCGWLLSHPAYLSWRYQDESQQHGRFLWIIGKADAGKSTMMSFARTQEQGSELTICYFANARDTETKVSISAMYKSLTVQLTREDVSQCTYDGLMTAGSEVYKHIPGPSPKPSSKDFHDTGGRQRIYYWDIDQLAGRFASAVMSLPDHPISCHIDILDEWDDREVQDLIAYLKILTKTTNGRFHVCLSSRRDYILTSLDADGLQIVLENEAGQRRGLTRYIQNHLEVGDGSESAEVGAEVQRQSGGVFLWVVLVVRILNEEFRKGGMASALHRLHEIPAGLDALYGEHPAARQSEKRTGTALLPVDPDMERLVFELSEGLVELVPSGPTVVAYFVHESVRDHLRSHKQWLLSRSDLDISAAHLSELDLESSIHERLCKCCRRLPDIEVERQILPMGNPRISSHDGAQSTRLQDSFPFLQHAASHVFYHADKIPAREATNDFLINFDLENWILILNATQSGMGQRFTRSAPLWYVSACQDSARLIHGLQQLGVAIPPTPQEQYRHPLLAAIANRCWNATRAILELCGSPHLEPVMEELRDSLRVTVRKESSPLLWAISNDRQLLAEMLASSSLVDVDTRGAEGHTALSLAARKGFLNVVEILLRKGAADSKKKPALTCAAREGHHDVLEVLLSHGIGVSSRKDASRCHDALYLASRAGHVEAVKVLLKYGTGIDAWWDSNPLCTASEEGHTEVVALLPNARREVIVGEECKPLYLTSKRGHYEVASVLLDAGVSANAQGGFYGTALQALCAALRHEDMLAVITLLLEAGADVNAQGGHFGNALQAASAQNAVQSDYQLQLTLPEQQNRKRLPAPQRRPSPTATAERSAPIDPQMLRMLHQEQARKRLLLAQQDANNPAPTANPAQPTQDPARADCETQLPLLEQQNKKRLLARRQENLPQTPQTLTLPFRHHPSQPLPSSPQPDPLPSRPPMNQGPPPSTQSSSSTPTLTPSTLFSPTPSPPPHTPFSVPPHPPFPPPRSHSPPPGSGRGRQRDGGLSRHRAAGGLRGGGWWDGSAGGGDVARSGRGCKFEGRAFRESAARGRGEGGIGRSWRS